MPAKVFTLNFEVFGLVQGVYFRKYTEKQAKNLSLTGWCKNTETGTVKGSLEGTFANLLNMKSWLQTKGSPKSKIIKAEFTDMIEIPVRTAKVFEIRR